MLTKMTLVNFLSFKEKTEFDFTPSKYTILNKTNVYTNEEQNVSVLKGSLFIGPNASGKTNALEGIIFLLKTLEDKRLDFDAYRCLFSREHNVKAIYEFLFEGKKIVYKIAFNRVTTELTEHLLVDGKLVLFRLGTRGELKLGTDSVTISPLDSETTFLRTASFNTGRFPQQPELRALMDYLLNSSYISGHHIEALMGSHIESYVEKNGVHKVNDYLAQFQYDFYAEYTSQSEGGGLSVDLGDKKKVILKRKNFPMPMPLILEAQGNRVFIDLLPQLIDVIESPGMLIIDEFGNSLHNSLAEKIVRFFMEYAQNSQLFITSHCTNLISNSVFRPDQIGIITFHGNSGSHVERISKYKPREAQNLEKMYLGGMFEGLPNYGEEI